MTLFCTDATVADRWLIFPVAVRVRPGWLVAADAPVFNCEHRWFRKYKYQYNAIQYLGRINDQNIIQKALVSRSGCSSFLMWPESEVERRDKMNTWLEYWFKKKNFLYSIWSSFHSELETERVWPKKWEICFYHSKILVDVNINHVGWAHKYTAIG